MRTVVWDRGANYSPGPDSSLLFSEFAKTRHNPVVKALTIMCTKLGQASMQSWVYAQQKLTRKWLVWILTTTLATLQVVINRIAKRLLEFVNSTPLKSDDIP